MKSKMKLSFVLLFFVALFLISATGVDVKKKSVPVKTQIPPISSLIKSPDLAVTAMKVSLKSTTIASNNESPYDQVKIEATIKNVGGGSVPPGASIHVNLTRDGTLVNAGTATDALSVPGSTWPYSYIDAVPHNLSPQYEYKLAVSGSFNEASTANNSASFVITEAALHNSGGAPDFTVEFICTKEVIDAANWSFNCRANVRNVGSGYSQGSSLVKIIRADDTQVLGSLAVDPSGLPAPGYSQSFYLTLKRHDIPMGKYNAFAVIQPVAGEANTNNNSSNPTEIVNQMYAFSATPSVAPTGTNVTLKWDCGNYPGKIDIECDGKYLGGKIKGLPPVGSREGVCPYGDTTYRFKDSATGQTLGAIMVQSSVPKSSIDDEDLFNLNGLLLTNIAGSLGDRVKIDSLAIKILASGVVVDLKGSYKKKNFEPIDIKVHALAWPKAPEGPITVEMKEFEVHIGSTATRILWDILTAGAYEIIRKELDDYFSNKYRNVMQRELVAQLRSFISVDHNGLIFFKLSNGVIDMYQCKFCHYPSVTGGL